MIKKLNGLKDACPFKRLQKIKTEISDIGVAVAFIFAIAVLLMTAGYVISRLASDRAYREKWKDYNDCGWA